MRKVAILILTAITQVGIGFLLFTPAFGQFGPFFKKDGAAGYRLGQVGVAGAGDVNADGTPDFIATACGPDDLAFVYSGQDGKLLYQKSCLTDCLRYRSVGGAGDLNGDDYDDFIVGSPVASPGGLFNAGAAVVYSGADGSVLYQKDGESRRGFMGRSMAGVGDLNGDTVPDFIIGAPGPHGSPFLIGSVFVYSGKDGSQLFRFDGEIAGDAFGTTVAGAGDINGDTVPDFIVGAAWDVPGGTGTGSVYVYSGRDGTLLRRKNGTVASEWFGGSVAGVGDLDGDGRADFIIGAPDPFSSAGRAFVYSGGADTLIYQKNGEAVGDLFGFSVAGPGDVDGDGVTDFLIGAFGAEPGGRNYAGSAYLYSGADGSLLYQGDGTAPADEFGVSVAGLGDVNGDGRAEFIIGAGGTDQLFASAAGSVIVFGFCATAQGDMNGDAVLTASDVMLMMDCVFRGAGDCFLCVADVNCDGKLAPADVVLELFAVFVSQPFPCL